jgi:hypothetical protein
MAEKKESTMSNPKEESITFSETCHENIPSPYENAIFAGVDMQEYIRRRAIYRSHTIFILLSW